jgi:hypothetical protein
MVTNLLLSAVKRPAGKGPLKISKPKSKAGGLGVKKMTKVDDSLFEQAPEEAAAAPAPVAMVPSPPPWDMCSSNPFPCTPQKKCFLPPYKWTPYEGTILRSDILSRRRPEDFVRESVFIRDGICK